MRGTWRKVRSPDGKSPKRQRRQTENCVFRLDQQMRHSSGPVGCLRLLVSLSPGTAQASRVGKIQKRYAVASHHLCPYIFVQKTYIVIANKNGLDGPLTNTNDKSDRIDKFDRPPSKGELVCKTADGTRRRALGTQLCVHSSAEPGTGRSAAARPFPSTDRGKESAAPLQNHIRPLKASTKEEDQRSTE